MNNTAFDWQIDEFMEYCRSSTEKAYSMRKKPAVLLNSCDEREIPRIVPVPLDSCGTMIW